MQVTKFDDIIIGSGPVAYGFTQALKANHDQRSVLVVENGDFGGTCPNAGCEPKIFLEGAVRNALISQGLQGRGIQQAATIDWEQLMTTKKAAFAPYPHNAAQAMQTKQIQIVQGLAHFVNDQMIQVNDHQYQGQRIIIATGMKPRRLNIPGKEFTHTSSDVLSLAHLPAKVTMIGGGYVSLELATLLSAAGAEVEIIEYSDQVLNAFDAAQVKLVVEQMQARGIQFHFGEAVNGVKEFDDGYLVSTSQNRSYETDYVVDASGRTPNIGSLELGTTQIKFDQQGIIVNDHLATNVPGIYAAGDVIKKSASVAPKLTPVAQFEGAYLAGTMDKAIHYPLVGTAAFTFPQIAQTGVSVQEAKNNSDYQIKRLNLANDFAYAGTHDIPAELIGVFDQHHNIVGVSEVSQSAADDINLFVSIIGLSIPAKAWQEQLIYIFPTLATKLKDFLAN